MKTLLLTLSFVMFSSNVFGQDSRVPSLDCVSVQGATVKFRLEEPPLIDCLIITGELSCDGMAVTALNECEHDIVLHAITREPDFSGLGPVPDAVRLRPNNPETFTLFMWWQDFTDGDMSWDSCEWFAREEVEIKTNRVCLIMSGTVATKPIEVADMGGDDLGNVDQGVEDDGILGSVSGADGGSDCSQTRAEPNIWAVLLLFGLFVRTKRN